MSEPSGYEINSWMDSELSPPEFPHVDTDLQTDWLIVGAGFTGLAAAAHLARLRHSDRIVMIDASHLGEGSSCRSSGFIVSLGHFDGSPRESDSLYRLGTAAIAQLKQQVISNAIDCDWNDSGRLIAARGNPGLRSLKRIRQTLERVGAGYTPIDAKHIECLTGMSGYLDGICQSESVQVNPAKLYWGLVAALPDNVEIFELSPVQSLKRQHHWVAQLTSRQIWATRVLITNEAHSAKLGISRTRVFPMQTFMSVFRCQENQPSFLGASQNWGLTSVERVGSSLRRVNNQIFFRSSAICGFATDKNPTDQRNAIANQHRHAVGKRFPTQKLECVNLWSGTIGVTANGSQLFGKADEGLYLSVGYNGHGIAQGTISGQLLVDLSLGRESELLNCVLGLPKPYWIPRPRLLYPIVDQYVAWLNWRYQDEI